MRARRRDLVLGATAAIAAGGSLPAPAIAQGLRELEMVTSWPANSPGMQTSADRLAASITALSEGRIRITVYPADTLVRAYEVFDAVGAGAADMYHTGEGVFEDKALALNFFCGTVPYGFTADELCAWIVFGGGQALWDEVDAQFNIKPLMAANSGVQMGGWFNKEINHPENFKGLRYRMPGLGAQVLRRMGSTVVTTPGGEIPTALNPAHSTPPSGSAPGSTLHSASIRRSTITTTQASTSPARISRSASTRRSGMDCRLPRKH